MSPRSALALLAAMSLASACVADKPAAPAAAPAPGFVSKPVQVGPVTGDDKREMVLLSVSIPSGSNVPMHTHPGDCVGSVAAGEVELLVQGQPARKLAPGDAYSNPRGTVHGFRNVGSGEARLLNTLVADKGVPRMVPAPAK